MATYTDSDRIFKCLIKFQTPPPPLICVGKNTQEFYIIVYMIFWFHLQTCSFKQNYTAYFPTA